MLKHHQYPIRNQDLLLRWLALHFHQNSEIYQLQNENEDLRERLQMLEEYTGKDSNFEMQKLVRDKKVLEKRVVQLETTHNWMQN